jgi:hypothetical protein
MNTSFPTIFLIFFVILFSIIKIVSFYGVTRDEYMPYIYFYLLIFIVFLFT